jgi:hypothetical protein
MPCRNPQCSHGWQTVDFPDGSGYYTRRTCNTDDQIVWNSPAMIDHHEASGASTSEDFCSLEMSNLPVIN